MLFGTSLLFRIAYFFTSFSPALFLLSLNFRCEKEFGSDNEFINSIISCLIYWIFPILIIAVAIIAAQYIKMYLIKRQNDKKFERENLALNFNVAPKGFRDTKNKHVIQVQDGVKINSGFIAFAISVVAPSVVLTLINNAQVLSSLIVILMFFLLLMMSNDVFPNIILPMWGIHLMTTKDNYNIFYLSKQSDFLSGVKKLNSLGNAGSLARTYVLSNESFADIELEDK